MLAVAPPLGRVTSLCLRHAGARQRRLRSSPAAPTPAAPISIGAAGAQPPFFPRFRPPYRGIFRGYGRWLPPDMPVPRALRPPACNGLGVAVGCGELAPQLLRQPGKESGRITTSGGTEAHRNLWQSERWGSSLEAGRWPPHSSGRAKTCHSNGLWGSGRAAPLSFSLQPRIPTYVQRELLLLASLHERPQRAAA